MTVIVSSHILSEIEQMADTVGIINHGRLRYQGPLSGLRDEGVLEFVTSDPSRMQQLLDHQDISCTAVGTALRTPVLPNERVARIVAEAVAAGVEVYRIQTVRKTLEQAFLELTDPVAGTAEGVR